LQWEVGNKSLFLGTNVLLTILSALEIVDRIANGRKNTDKRVFYDSILLLFSLAISNTDENILICQWSISLAFFLIFW
jgi:hypothetical protein